MEKELEMVADLFPSSIILPTRLGLLAAGGGAGHIIESSSGPRIDPRGTPAFMLWGIKLILIFALKFVLFHANNIALAKTMFY